MNKCLAWSAFLVALIYAGCATPTRTRFEVGQNAEAIATPSPAEREAVKQILAEVAREVRLKDFTSTSIVPETIAFYQQEAVQNPVKIIAWIENDRILVDLMQFPSQPGETMLYRRTRESLRAKLNERFGERSAAVDFRELNRTPPVETR